MLANKNEITEKTRFSLLTFDLIQAEVTTR